MIKRWCQLLSAAGIAAAALLLLCGCGNQLGKSKSDPLGTSKKLTEFITASGFKLLSDEKKVLPGGKEKARVRVYQDKSTSREGDYHDLIVVVTDSNGKVRAVGAQFLNRSATNIYQGKAERFIRGYWKDITTADPTPSNDGYGSGDDSASNDVLEAKWRVDSGLARVSVAMKDSGGVVQDSSRIFGESPAAKSKSRRKTRKR